VSLADLGHLRVGEATDVVHHVEAVRERLVGHLGVASLDGPDRLAVGPLENLQRALEPLRLDFHRLPGVLRVGRLQSDVDDIGALGGHLFGVGDCVVHVAPGAGGVVRLDAHVQHAHDLRWVAVTHGEPGDVDWVHERSYTAMM